MIGNQIQRTSKTGFYWKVWENKWVFNCDLNEEYVCVWRMEKGRLFQADEPLTRKGALKTKQNSKQAFQPSGTKLLVIGSKTQPVQVKEQGIQRSDLRTDAGIMRQK